MAKGTIKWFDELKGYGFISPEDGGKDIFFHKSNVESENGSIDDNVQVEYEVTEGKKGNEAIKVRVVKVES